MRDESVNRRQSYTASASHLGAGAGLRKAGVFFLVVFLFLIQSRVADFWLVGLHVPLIASLLAMVCAVMTGGVQRALFTPFGFWLSAFSIWLIVAIPFSYWPGGSADLVVNTWSKSFLVFVIVAGLIGNITQFRLAVIAIGVGTAVTAFICLWLGNTALLGRISVQEQSGGALANPNDLAQLLLIGLPFLISAAFAGGVFRRLVGTSAVFATLIVVARSGSRSALVTFAVLMICIFFTVTWANKAKMAVMAALLVVLVLPFISADQRARYLTLVNDDVSSTAEPTYEM